MLLVLVLMIVLVNLFVKLYFKTVVDLDGNTTVQYFIIVMLLAGIIVKHDSEEGLLLAFERVNFNGLEFYR